VSGEVRRVNGGDDRHAPCSLVGIAHRWTYGVFLAAGALVAGTGCSLTVGRLPVVSTRAVAPEDLVRPPLLTHTTVGRSCTWVAVVAPVTPPPSLGDAIDAALTAASAAALWDARISYEITYFFPVGRGCYVVEGRVP
jgi:hypothetical protein